MATNVQPSTRDIQQDVLQLYDKISGRTDKKVRRSEFTERKTIGKKYFHDSGEHIFFVGQNQTVNAGLRRSQWIAS